MSAKKIDWMIHFVNMADPENEMLGNSHTHGLDRHGHRELCIVLNMDPAVAGNVLNSMGIMIVSDGVKFTEGIREDVLRGGYNVEIKTIENDPVLYVILPDEKNRLPLDEGCAFPYNMQYEYMKLISEHTKKTIG